MFDSEMMGSVRKFEGLNAWLNVSVAAVGVVSVDYFQRLFSDVGWRGAYYLLPPLLLIILGMNVVDRGANLVIEKSRWLRRALAGKDDIEGDWVNVVVAADEPQLVKAIEYCRIRYCKGRFELSGNQWTTDGKWVQEFVSADSTYSSRVLEYYYKTGLHRVGGYCAVRFFPADSTATDYLARYVDEECVVPHVTRGRRLSRKFSDQSLEKRLELAMVFHQHYEEEGLLHTDQGIR